MNKRSRPGRGKSQTKSSRAKIAARTPRTGARNRPGFDLGGAVGDTKKPRKAARKVVGGRSGIQGNADKTQSAVAGVRNWLRKK